MPTNPRQPHGRARLILLAVVVLLIGVALTAVYFVRKQKMDQHILTLRGKGLTALEESKFSEALNHLGTYLRRHPDDLDALLGYAQAREKVVAGKGQHITQTISAYRRVLDLDRTRMQARRELLRLYEMIRYHAEVLAIANDILEFEPKDHDSLLARATAYALMRDHPKALAAVTATTELHPQSIDAHLLALFVMRELQKPVEEIVAYPVKYREAAPEDPRFQLIQGVAHRMVGQRKEALEWFEQAAKAQGNDATFFDVLMRNLDDLGEFQISTATLARAATDAGDARLRALYATRLWHTGMTDQLATLTRDLDPADPRTDAQLLIYRAMLLNQGHTREQARAIVDHLAKRPTTDTVATAWVPVFREVLFVDAPDPKTVVRIADEAMARLATPTGDPDLLLMRGNASAALGETLLAMDYWRRAADRAPAWAVPHIQQSRTLTDLGRGEEALAAARDALSRSPGNFRASIALALAAFSLDEKRIKQDELLALVKSIQDRLPDEEETLVMYVTLLVRNNQQEQAKKLLARLADPAAPAPAPALAPTTSDEPATPIARKPLSQQTFIRLATVSDQLNLDAAGPLLQRTIELHGLSAPVALYRARRLHPQQSREQVLAAFQRDWNSMPNAGNDTAWRVAHAGLLTEVNDPGAGANWIALADSLPEHLGLQRMVIEQPSVQGDRPFMARTIDRLRKLSGDQGTAWRVAQARAILQRDPGKTAAAEAAVLLREVIDATYDDVEARRLLSICFQRMTNISAAIEQHEIAVQQQPHRTDLALELASLHQASGDFTKSRKLIDDLLDRQAMSRTQRQFAARLLAAQGATDTAITALEIRPDDDDPDAAADGQGDLLLARLYWLRKQPDKARPIFEALLAKGDASPMLIQMAATFHADQGDTVRAGQILAMLDQAAGLSPGVRELLLADHYNKIGDKARAAAQYAAAVKAAPDSVPVWRQYAAFLVVEGKLAEAAALLDQGLARLADDSSLAFIRQHMPLIRRAVAMDMNRLRPLVLALIADPEHQAAAAAVMQEIVTSEDRKTDVVTLMAQLRRHADNHPRFLDLQNLVASTYVLVGRPDEAVTLAQRTMATFPTASTPAAIAAASLAMAKRWREVIPAADAWLARSPGDVVRVDVLKAEALMHTSQIDRAVKLLEPHWTRISGLPDATAQLRDVGPAYLRLLIAAKREADFLATATRLVQGDPVWAVTILNLLQQGGLSPEVSVQTVTIIEAAVPANQLQTRLILVQTRLALERSTGDALHLQRARAILDDMLTHAATTNEPLSPALLFMDAMVHAAQENWPKAEQRYRETLRLQPDNYFAKNNLAMVLISRPATGSGATEAVTLARQAVQALPASASLRDTLASSLIAAGEPAKAVEELQEAIRLEPNTLQWQVNLCWALLEANDMARARQTYQAIEPAVKQQKWTAKQRERIENIQRRLG